MKKIGLLIPCTNLTVEYELQHLYNLNYFKYDKTTFYISKLEYKTNYKENKIKFLEDISKDEKNKIKELSYLNVDYIASFCTSASIIGEKMINNPADAIIQSAMQKNIKKCMLITPYNHQIGNELKRVLIENKIDVVHNINLDLLHTSDYFEFGLNKLEQFIVDNYKEEYKNIIISCTNIPTIHFINRIQEKLNCNVISSNSSMFELLQKI